MQSCEESRTKNPQGKIKHDQISITEHKWQVTKSASAKLTLWFLSISFIVSFSLANVGRSLGISSQHFSIIWYLINKNCMLATVRGEERRFVTKIKSSHSNDHMEFTIRPKFCLLGIYLKDQFSKDYILYTRH